MKRRPEQEHTDVDTHGMHPRASSKAHGLASTVGDIIRPFLVSGGQSYFLFDSGPPTFNPITEGVQLICSLYVPAGSVGFVKQIRVGPYMPSVLSDPWLTSGIANNQASWRYQNRLDTAGDFISPQPGDLWRTPFGWESVFTDETEVRPTWRWSLRAQQGDVANLRNQGQNIPAFDISDPQSWYLVPDIAVPASAYPTGIPGNSVGANFNAQRVQCIPGDELETHLVIEQDTTLMLFAEWRQEFGEYATGYVGSEFVNYAGENARSFIVPILPSFGQLHGYMQALTSDNTKHNATNGWGG